MIDKFYNKTLYELETAINDLEIEIDCPLQRIEAAIHLIVNCLSDLKEHVLKTGFENVDEEIRFSNIRSLPLFQNSFITILFTKSRQRSLMEQNL